MVIKKIKETQVLEDRFAKKYNGKVNKNQRKGSAWDMELPSGERVEIKFDHSSLKTGNLFIEIEYSRDSGTNWDDSGLSLAKEQAEWFVVVSGSEEYWFDSVCLYKFLRESNCEIKEIRRGINGNREGMTSRGYILPITSAIPLTLNPPACNIKKVTIW